MNRRIYRYGIVVLLFFFSLYIGSTAAVFTVLAIGIGIVALINCLESLVRGHRKLEQHVDTLQKQLERLEKRVSQRENAAVFTRCAQCNARYDAQADKCPFCGNSVP